MRLGIRIAALTLVLGVVLAGCGEEEKLSWGRRAELSLLVLYCGYGAVSKPQFKSCVTHVDAVHVLELTMRKHPTPAAEFAVGWRRPCGATSGPICPQIRSLAESVGLWVP